MPERGSNLVAINYVETVDTLRQQATMLITVCVDSDRTSVPSCPGWDVAALRTHLQYVYRWAADSLQSPPDQHVRLTLPTHEESASTEQCLRSLRELVRALREARPDDICAGPRIPRTAAWWARRQLIETVVHRWDVEAAVGSPTDIAPSLAAMGVSEFLELFAAQAIPRAGLCLQASDLPLAWHVDPDEFGTAITITGKCADLLLLLWGRLSLRRVEIDGDPGIYLAWREAIAT